MAFLHRTFAWAWLVVLCLVASSASGMISDRNLAWWILGGIVAPATMLTLVARVRRPAEAANPRTGRAGVAPTATTATRTDNNTA
jgi:hypothetical protein